MALKTCTRSAGAVRAYGKIEIRLSQDTVITATGLDYMASPVFVTAAADGSYTVQLQASNDLTPNGTYYTVTEYAIGTDYTYTVVVPQTAGPFDLVTIQTNPPSASPTPSHVSTLTVDGGITAGSLSASDQNFGASVSTPGQIFQSAIGTTAVPDTSITSGFKISRAIKRMDADPYGTGSDPSASTMVVYTRVDAASERQGIGVYAITQTASTTALGGGRAADGVAFFGLGMALAGSTHIGQGAYLEGYRTDTTGQASALEARVTNQAGSDGVYSTTAFSGTVGIWLTGGGNARPAAGIQLAGVAGNQWVVGLGFVAGSVQNQSIRDDSSSATSILINGTHATAAMAVAASAGSVIVGGTSLVNAGCLLEVQGPNSAVQPLAMVGTASFNQTYDFRVRNASGQIILSVCTAGAVLTGTALGDGVLQAGTSGKALHLGGTTKVVSVTKANTLGFFAATPVAQQATTGTSTGFTAGGGTTVTDASTFTGGTGATAYRISDIVLALKNYGLMAA